MMYILVTLQNTTNWLSVSTKVIKHNDLAMLNQK